MGEVPFGRKTFSDPDRKHPRFRTRPLHNLALQPSDDKPYLRIANISLGGLGFFSNEVTASLKSTFSATLTIGDQNFEVTLEKRFENKEMTGCQFINPSQLLHDCINKYFETELLASRVNKIETKAARTKEQDRVLYFHGQNNCELLINERRGQICYFSVVILGNSIEVTPKIKMVAGELILDESIPKRDGVSLFKTHQQVDKHLIDTAIRFIDSIDGLELQYKENLIQLLSESTGHQSKTANPSQVAGE